MKTQLISAVLALALLPLAGVAGNIFQAKLRVQKNENSNFSKDGLFYLPASHVQKSDGVQIEAEQPHKLEYHKSEARMQVEKDCASILNVRAMEFHFEVVKPGKYRAWYRGNFPTSYSYNHRERMDDGETSGLIPDSENLPKNIWRWHSGPVYQLEKGKHVWQFPSPSAWCGGAKLDKLLLLPENETIDTGAGPDAGENLETKVCIPERGEIVMRRIKTKQIRKWIINADTQLNGGKFTAEYRYNGEQQFRPLKIGEWQMVPEGVRYLYFRFQLEKAKDATVSPFVYNIAFLVQEK